MINIHILTRCSRPQTLLIIKESIFSTDKFNIIWHILFDVFSIKDINSELLFELSSNKNIIIKYLKASKIDV